MYFNRGVTRKRGSKCAKGAGRKQKLSGSRGAKSRLVLRFEVTEPDSVNGTGIHLCGARRYASKDIGRSHLFSVYFRMVVFTSGEA